MKKILLLGASGRTGKEVLQLALSKGYHIHALVRDSKKIELGHPHLWVFEGDPRIPKDLHIAIDSCNGVISCLNISRTSDFPWAPLRTPEDFLSMTMKNLISTCKENEVKRLIFTSAWGVGDSRQSIPSWLAWLIDNSNLAPAYLEHERQEAMVKNSGLDWTIVRPVALLNNCKEKAVKAYFKPESKPRLTISRKNVAQYIVDIFDQQDLIHKMPVISH
jgi:uncharacterized protein YbjT (DUF2867 family)